MPEPSPDQSPEISPTTSATTSSTTSATTGEVPAFGWSGYAERVNGRFAMVGFLAVLLIEALSGETFLRWSGLVP
ncbi:high light inducible protein [Cyanobium sp. A1C-AMD]|uniref:chlorophyll a/b-binding protein n=1 Tax=Cyanobium sp. A1C-AMD TaxID=2823694 RepID=UPI0020CBDF25|nr:chlorophyll a/b-binding protein [Cyanobium sp. A1C-AMD]MCP9878929.1 high light inducible protein [Cyanobium sp. A1C-AMD]